MYILIIIYLQLFFFLKILNIQNDRFMEVYNYYSAVFDSLDATLPRDSTDRMNVERQCLARDIVNIVACEGADRIER